MLEKDIENGEEAVNILQSCGGTYFLRIALSTYHEDPVKHLEAYLTDLKIPLEKYDKFISSREIGNLNSMLDITTKSVLERTSHLLCHLVASDTFAVLFSEVKFENVLGILKTMSDSDVNNDRSEPDMAFELPSDGKIMSRRWART